ncbi:MAG TPA: ABC transporter ATP-binding protein [Cyclobacteriaceae bacterium]
MKPILEIQNISKKFRISHQTGGYLSLRERMVNALKFEKNSTEDFWALKDVSFEVQAGESIGIIGRNGAGKSTLLKILSKITPPTQGKIISRGRIASLLEVGTGFHPELTGRENIFLNGSLLGMKRKEIESKFDEIVDFSGVEKFLDTPLKHYSSGMQLRLAFAVAAFLEPEILIIDEVLAVGDAEFQKKCLGKMEDVSKSGRTILFVSHNLPSLKAICTKGFLLDKGILVKQGEIENVINAYTYDRTGYYKILDSIKHSGTHGKVNNVKINGSDQSHVLLLESKSIHLDVDITFNRKTAFELQVHVKKDDVLVCSFARFVTGSTQIFEPMRYNLEYDIELPDLRSGRYKLDIFFTEPFVALFARSENDVQLEFVNEGHHVFLNTPAYNWWGSVLLEGKMKYNLIGES